MLLRPLPYSLTRVNSELLHSSYRGIEVHLNHVIDEYMSNRHRLERATDGLAVGELPRLHALLQGKSFVVKV